MVLTSAFLKKIDDILPNKECVRIVSLFFEHFDKSINGGIRPYANLPKSFFEARMLVI
jgi:hypothetical protein